MRWIKTALVLGAALALAGCRESEQGRPLAFEPGVYKGQKTPELSAEQLRALQERANIMR